MNTETPWFDRALLWAATRFARVTGQLIGWLRRRQLDRWNA